MDDQNTMDVFRTAPVPTAVLKNTLPAMAAMLMVLVYNLADTFFIGQTHDDYQVAAVSLAMPVFLVFMAVGTLFGMGGTSVISRALGEGKPDYARNVCSFCMWSCAAVGTAMAALFLVFMDPILTLVGVSPDTEGFARSYLTIVSLCGPFVLIANCYSNVIRAEGKSNQAMMGQLLGYCVGAKNWDRFRQCLRFALLFALGLGTAMTAACYVLLHPIVGAFLSDSAALDYGVQFSRILLTTSFLFGVYYVLINTLQAMGAAGPTMVVNLSRQGLIFLPAMFLLQSLMGITGLVWAQPAADVLSTLLSAVLYRRTAKAMSRA